MSLSFQFQKHLSLGRGGAVLCSNKDEYDALKRLSYDGRMPGIPWRDQDIKSFGLHTYQRQTIIKVSNESNPKNIMDDTNNDNLMFTPEQKEKKRKSPIFRYAAIGIIGLALFGASYYFGDRYVTEQQVAEQEKPQKQIKLNVQEAAFDI